MSWRVRVENQEVYDDPLEVEDIDRDYCNDFVCTSSPLVEESIKAFAVDLQRPGRWTTSRFPDDISYKDPLRSFKGKQVYERLNWVGESVERPRVKVQKLKMLDRDKCDVTWRLTGNVLGQPIDVGFTSTITLNLLSGRITEHRDQWDLKECPPNGALAFYLSRWLWSLGQIKEDVIARYSDEDDDGEDDLYLIDPNDPYTFYEKDTGDGFVKDSLTFFTFVALLYLAYRAYYLVFQL